MNNTIFYLIGNTAAARRAVAQELAALTGARIVDSQDIYAPIFNLLATQKPADVPKKLLRFDEADALFLNATEVQPRDAATRIVAAAEAASIP